MPGNNLEDLAEGGRGRDVYPPRAGARPDTGPPSGALLDTSTNIRTPPELVDQSTGEILSVYDPTLKFQLQAKARVAMGVFDKSVPYEERHRLRICCRHIRTDLNEVQVRVGENERPYLFGVQACGSVWVCPVCAAKIQAHRAAEVRAGIEAWKELGGVVLMMGPTVPHVRSDSLQELLQGFNQAMQYMHRGAPWKRLEAAYSLAGRVKGLEVTWGVGSGWHPHAHVLLFLEELPDMGELFVDLFGRWQSSAVRAGFSEPSVRAFSLQDAGAVKTYITKMGHEYQWNAEHELVKSHSKSARGERFSPFDLLGSNLDESRPELLHRFREFGEAFYRKNQLVWSRGFKKQLLGAEGLTDQAIADAGGEFERICASVFPSDWAIVRRFNLQGDFVQVAHKFGKSGVENLLSHYRERMGS